MVKPAKDSAPTSLHPSAASALVIRQAFSVPFAYDVVFTRDALDAGNPVLVDALTAADPARQHRVLVVIDEGLEAAWPELRGWVTGYFAHHAGRIALAAAPIGVVGGEAAKNDPALITRLHTLIHQHGIDRHSYIVIIGGGGVQDAVGYASATAHRGIRTVRMPTTVLGQNDSGVGVKNGINAFGAKNFVGTFVPPYAVINDFRFLERLPTRERVAGMAEAVKVSLIRDASFFAWLDGHSTDLALFDRNALATLIRRCAELHLRHIGGSGDPFERGSARPLDFGHWAAHKLESMTSHGVRHGEAVSIGLVLDSRYSVEAGMLSEVEFTRIFDLIGRLGLPRWHDALDLNIGGRLAVLGGLDDFREHLGGDLTVTLLRGIGHGVEVNEIQPALVEKALGWMRAHR